MAMVAAVLVDSAADRVFDYAVPAALGPLMPGTRVEVPLRARRAAGTVLAVRPAGQVVLPPGVELKPLLRILDEEPMFTAGLLELARWVAAYYLAPLEQVMRAMVPAAVRPEDNRPRTRTTARLLGPAPAAADLERLRRRAPRQAAILEVLAEAAGAVPVAELGESGKSGPALRALAAQGLVVLAEEEVGRDPLAGVELVETLKPVPTPDQQAAIAAIAAAAAGADPRPLLLMGVTGSGKTEVYLSAIEAVVAGDRSAIVLVPEISLTPQTVERFRSRFTPAGVGVAVLHSRLSDGERFDEWRRIRRGEARVVVGPRSAVFAPVARLGIIVVDEEHEGSYKQDKSPRYHARDIAVVRGGIEGAVVVLGSATPSLESFRNTSTGKYQLVRMDHRIDHRTMPLVRVVDMRIEARKRREVTILSEPLRRGIELRLERGEQVILFLNRRGFARALQCPACGHACSCPHCSVTLTYHKTGDHLLCHVCGHRARVPARCPECRDPAIRMAGFGTQRAEEIVAKVFPKRASPASTATPPAAKATSRKPCAPSAAAASTSSSAPR
jgi:primosomal protein N' (replication factor Y) (superfamily II helicase)